MDEEKWKKYLFSCNYPPSLTSQSRELKKEAREFIIKATTGFDKRREILVLGCGDGYEVDLLKRFGFKNSIGITLLEEEKKDRTDVILGDIHNMPFSDSFFDYVISMETLEHMISPPIALMEINRVMKKEGRFVHYIPEGIQKQRDWYHYACYPDWLWCDLFYKNGFEVTEIRDDIKQVKYSGFKFKEPNWMTEQYDLDVYYKERRI